MLKTKAKHFYKAFGYRIESELPIPDLLPADDGPAAADVRITVDDELKKSFDAAPFEIVVDEADPAVTLLIPDGGVFRIEGGHSIIVSPIEGADEGLLRLYILGTCFGVLLMQRGIYPLHGSAIAIEGKAYLFVGHSGAGKSTLAAAFIERGCKLLSDDVIAVSMQSGEAAVIPSYPQQKLWQQSLDALGSAPAELRSIYGRESKYCVAVGCSYYESPLPIGAIFELILSDRASVELEQVGKLERLPLLAEHTYRQYIVPKLNLIDWHFQQSAKLAGSYPAYRLHRPQSGFSARQLANEVFNIIAMEESK